MTDTAGSSVSLGQGIDLPKLGFGVWLVDAGAEAEKAVGWALGPATAISTPPRTTATRRASARRSRTAACLARRSSSRRSSDRAARTRRSRPEEPRAAGAGPRRPVPRALAGRRADPGLGRQVQAPERGWRAIGVSNFTSTSSRSCWRRPRSAGGEPDRAEPVRPSAGAGRSLRRHGIVVEAYSPLTRPRPREPASRRVAAALGRTPAQVLLRWGLQHDLVVLPKSVNPSGSRERPDLRLHPVRRGHGRARRARPHERHREGRREPLVVGLTSLPGVFGRPAGGCPRRRGPGRSGPG